MPVCLGYRWISRLADPMANIKRSRVTPRVAQEKPKKGLALARARTRSAFDFFLATRGRVSLISKVAHPRLTCANRPLAEDNWSSLGPDALRLISCRNGLLESLLQFRLASAESISSSDQRFPISDGMLFDSCGIPGPRRSFFRLSLLCAMRCFRFTKTIRTTNLRVMRSPRSQGSWRIYLCNMCRALNRWS